MTLGDFARAQGICCSCCSAGVGRVPWPRVVGGGSGALTPLHCQQTSVCSPTSCGADPPSSAFSRSPQLEFPALVFPVCCLPTQSLPLACMLSQPLFGCCWLSYLSLWVCALKVLSLMFEWHFRKGRSEAQCSIHCISPDFLLSINWEANMSLE